MHICAMTPDLCEITVNLSLREYLQGPVLSNLAAFNNGADPHDILMDYIPGDPSAMEDDELAQRLGEACVLAAGFEPVDREALHYLEIQDVQVEPQDLLWFKQQFLPNHGMELVQSVMPLVARATSPFGGCFVFGALRSASVGGQLRRGELVVAGAEMCVSVQQVNVAVTDPLPDRAERNPSLHPV